MLFAHCPPMHPPPFLPASIALDWRLHPPTHQHFGGRVVPVSNGCAG